MPLLGLLPLILGLRLHVNRHMVPPLLRNLWFTIKSLLISLVSPTLPQWTIFTPNPSVRSLRIWKESLRKSTHSFLSPKQPWPSSFSDFRPNHRSLHAQQIATAKLREMSDPKVNHASSLIPKLPQRITPLPFPSLGMSHWKVKVLEHWQWPGGNCCWGGRTYPLTKRLVMLLQKRLRP